MSARPVVTIGLLALGLRPHLRQAIASVIQQIFTDWKAIVSDDMNSDQAREEVASFQDPRLA